MFVSDILRTKGNAIHSGTPDMTVARAASEMTGRKIGSLLVLEGGGASLAGILSERDIVRGIATFGPECLDGPVSQLMTRGVTTIGPGRHHRAGHGNHDPGPLPPSAGHGRRQAGRHDLDRRRRQIPASPRRRERSRKCRNTSRGNTIEAPGVAENPGSPGSGRSRPPRKWRSFDTPRDKSGATQDEDEEEGKP